MIKRSEVWTVRYPRSGAEFGRALAFFDSGAVVALTLLAINVLNRPRHDYRPETWHQDFEGLLLLRNPAMVALIISFVFVGMFWLGHHLMVAHLVAIDRSFILANLVYLFFVTLAPVAAIAMAEHSKDPYAIGFYGAWLIALTVMQCVLAWLAGRRALFAPSVNGPTYVRDEFVLGAIRVVVFGIAIAVAYLTRPALSLWVLVPGLVASEVFQRRRTDLRPVEAEGDAPT